MAEYWWWWWCYWSCNEGVFFSTWSHIGGSWYFPTFLCREGSLTLRYMASLISWSMPVPPCPLWRNILGWLGVLMWLCVGVWVRLPWGVPCICHQVFFLIPLCIVQCSLCGGICTCKWFHSWLVWGPCPWVPLVVVWLCLCLEVNLDVLFVASPFKLFSQTLYVWYD